jgi:uncharacterized protein (UPF0210 family)
MALIRSLTIHVKPLGDVKDFKDLVDERLDIIKKLVRELGLDVWSYRVVLPPGLPTDYQLRLTQDLCRDDVLLASYHVDASEVRSEDIVSVLTSCERSYITVRLPTTDLIDNVTNLYSKLIKSIDVNDFTRLGISIPDYIVTPYFPLATTYDEGISVALRYVDLFYRYVRGDEEPLIKFILNISRLVSELAGRVGMKFLGFDYSLSPWLSESVVGIIEYLSGIKFAYPGSGYAVKKLNELISRLSSTLGISNVGFNEVMLPVAEDDLLKERVAEGSVTLKDLTYLCSYCLVGVDMVVLRDDVNLIKGVVKDVFTSSVIKGRVIGVRLIPTNASEGSEVLLKRFGKVPVIKV